MHKLEMGATKLHTWGPHGQVEIKSCRVVGQVRRDPEVREIINSTHSILWPTLGAISQLLLPPHCGSGGLWCWRLPAQVAGRMGGHRLER